MSRQTGARHGHGPQTRARTQRYLEYASLPLVRCVVALRWIVACWHCEAGLVEAGRTRPLGVRCGVGRTWRSANLQCRAAMGDEDSQLPEGIVFNAQIETQQADEDGWRCTCVVSSRHQGHD